MTAESAYRARRTFRVPNSEVDREAFFQTYETIKDEIEGDDCYVWWKGNREFRRTLAEALKNWELACRFAEDHDAGMQRAVEKQIYHPGWELIHEAYNRLTWLGSQCMTVEQARAAYELPQNPEEIDAQA